MVLGAIGDTGYNIMLFIHILAMIVAFAPSFVWPFVNVTLRNTGDADPAATINRMNAGSIQRIYGPALVLGGLVGFGLAGMSEKVYSMSQTWLVLAAIVWVALIAIYFGLITPTERKISAGDSSAAKMLGMAHGIVHLLAAVGLLLMVFKPGFG